jgi:hypothetical protein
MMSEKLLLTFRQQDSPYGVTRATVQALAAALDVSETMAIHVAVSRFAKEVLPAYDADAGPLTAADTAWLRKAAQPRLPKGPVKSRKTLF